MTDLKRFSVCDLVHTPSVHLLHVTPSSTQALAVATVSILRMVRLAVGLCGAHDVGEDANENNPECRKARTDDTHIDFDIYHNVSNQVASFELFDLLDQLITAD